MHVEHIKVGQFVSCAQGTFPLGFVYSLWLPDVKFRDKLSVAVIRSLPIFTIFLKINGLITVLIGHFFIAHFFLLHPVHNNPPQGLFILIY